MLIEPAELQRRLESAAAVTVLDVRWRLGGPPGRRDYEESHVPGAVFVDLDEDLSGAPGQGGRHPLPARADFAAAMRRLGVRSSVPVVVYDAADSTSAARCWWLLAYFGHRDVSILDGGFRAWVEAGGTTETGAGAVGADGDFAPDPGHLPLLDADGAAGLARAGILLDARPGARYRGEVEPIDQVAGHIPGALSAPTSENLDAEDRWRPVADLQERFRRLGATAGAGGRPVGAYCGSGVTAAHEVFALRLAGIEAALYVGSWSEWSRDPSRPVATGPEPG